MYSISELNEMNDSDLKGVAESMGLKKIDMTQKENLIYRILDQQALNMSSDNSAEKKRREPAAPRQPRKQVTAKISAMSRPLRQKNAVVNPRQPLQMLTTAPPAPPRLLPPTPLPKRNLMPT